jgi:hypothetical protein
VASPINPLHVVLERLGCSDPAIGAFFPWDEVRDWPPGALDGLVASGLLQPAQPMSVIECDGCEENCMMPVTVYPAQEGKPGKAFITCDKRDDIGRVQVDFRRMEQWQATGGRIAAALSGLLDISQPTIQAADGGQWRIGTLKGRKHNGQATLVVDGNSLTLALAGHTIPLVDVLAFEKSALTVDKAALIRMVDNPVSKGETETPEERKARLIARVNQEKAKRTKAFLKIVAEEEGFDVSRLKQIIYGYPKEKSSATPANPWAGLQVQKKRTSLKKPQTKY